jgi:hypothetical protein
MSLQPQSLWRVKRLLVALGIDVPEGPFELDEQDLVGLECVARVTQVPHYSDKSRKVNDITDILSADGDEVEANWGN